MTTPQPARTLHRQPARNLTSRTLLAVLLSVWPAISPAAGRTSDSTATDTAGRLPALFFSPEERQALDAQWQARQQPVVQGEVRREDGKRTRWIDGQMESGPTGPSTARASHPPHQARHE